MSTACHTQRKRQLCRFLAEPKYEKGEVLNSALNTRAALRGAVLAGRCVASSFATAAARVYEPGHYGRPPSRPARRQVQLWKAQAVALIARLNQQGGECTLLCCAFAPLLHISLLHVCVLQDLWDAGSTRDLITLAVANKFDVGKILEELVGPADGAAAVAVASASLAVSPAVAAANSPVSPSTRSPPKPANILEASEQALSYNLGGSKVYQDFAAEEEKRKAEAKAREEAAKKAAARQAKIVAGGGIDASVEAAIAKRKAEE